MSKSGRDGIYVLGAGGHAKVVIATLEARGDAIAGVLDDDEALWGTELMGCPVIGSIATLENMESPSAIIAIGVNRTRMTVAGKYPHVRWESAIHPASTVHPSATIGRGTVVFAGTVVQPGAVIGEHCIINTCASVDHDCRFGNFVHIAPGCRLAGNVTLKDGVFMGVGSCAIPGITVGNWTTVGAGGAVVRSLPEHVTAVGVPALPGRKE